MGIEDKNTKNSIKSKNYPKSKTLRELKKLDIDWLIYNGIPHLRNRFLKLVC